MRGTYSVTAFLSVAVQNTCAPVRLTPVNTGCYIGVLVSDMLKYMGVYLVGVFKRVTRIGEYLRRVIPTPLCYVASFLLYVPHTSLALYVVAALRPSLPLIAKKNA